MKEYWIAKLLSAVETVECRKRLQKAIYLLQQRKRCPLDFGYYLHYYGPYSSELKDVTDQLCLAGILQEVSPAGDSGGYTLSITKHGKDVLAAFEKSTLGRRLSRLIAYSLSPFKQLAREDLTRLELAATIAFFHRDSWDHAEREAAKFKHVRAPSKRLTEARRLAEECAA